MCCHVAVDTTRMYLYIGPFSCPATVIEALQIVDLITVHSTVGVDDKKPNKTLQFQLSLFLMLINMLQFSKEHKFNYQN